MDKDKYVLITGGTMGIGYELARCFAEENYNLVLVARSKKDLQNRKKEFENNFGIKVLTISTDLFNPENATKVYREIKANKINIEILVNNAGQGVYGEFSDTDIKREMEKFSTFLQLQVKVPGLSNQFTMQQKHSFSHSLKQSGMN